MSSGFVRSISQIEVAFTLHALLRDTTANVNWRQTCLTGVNAFSRADEEAEAQDLLRFLRNQAADENYRKEIRVLKQG